jgi:hypothetical protein
MLDGVLKENSEQAVALLFAQYYADESGKYNETSYSRVQEVYGKEKSSGILATIKLIMMGNVFMIVRNIFRKKTKI